MIHTATISVGGEDALLLIAEPEWGQGLRATARLPLDLQESLTGVQERRPDASIPRWSIRYEVVLADTQLQQLRSVMGAIEHRRVAMPFWPDAYGGPAILSSDLRAGWSLAATGQPTGVNVETAGGTPTGDYVAALLLGRLTIKVDPLEPGAAVVELNFTEDAPAAYRATPAAGPATWEWEFDWLDAPQQGQRSLEQYGVLGRSGLGVPEGEPVRVWTQAGGLTLSRAAARDMLGFWADHGGGHEAFDLSGPLRPGTATAAAPHDFDSTTGRMRFARQELALEWSALDLCAVSVLLEQQIEVADHAESPEAVAYLYTLTHDGVTVRLTDWDAAITAGGHTYTPGRIEHDRIRQSLKPQNEECELLVWLDDAPLLEPLLRMESTSPVAVSIDQMILPAGTPSTIWTGSAWRVRADGKRLKVTVAAFGGALGRKLPRFQWSHLCNHTLFSGGCARAQPLVMDDGVWECTGDFDSQSAATGQLVLLGMVFATALGAKPTTIPGGESGLLGFFAGGWLETGTGTSRQVRPIVNSWYAVESGTPKLYLYIPRPLREDIMAAGQEVRFWPGCDGQITTCRNIFDNGAAFGGFPFQPGWIEQAPIGMPKGGK